MKVERLETSLPGVESRKSTRTVAAINRKMREVKLQRCSLSHDQACCFHPPFVDVMQYKPFFITSNLDSKLMLKETDQIVMRKANTVIRSLLLCRPNYQSRYSQDREKPPSF